MKFSELTEGFDRPTNRLYDARAALAAQAVPVTDLVSGLGGPIVTPYPQRVLERALSSGARQTIPYRPDPKGQRPARVAIQAFYAKDGVSLSEDAVVLTPGTSLSYWYLFKLLATPGDEILSPQPCYPLFDSIAQLSDVALKPYPLDENRAWAIDLDRLELAITKRTRAILLVSPHNPTGHVADRETLNKLADIASRHSLAIISDEVFSPFLFKSPHLPRMAQTQAPLVFTLNGFSKMFALPGVKIGWIAVTGDATLVARSLIGLEMFSDTFLPVQEAAQGAVPAMFAGGQTFMKRYQNAVDDRAAQCVQIIKRSSRLSMIPPAGGFYATIRLDDMDEEDAALRLLSIDKLLVHPGYFYDIPGNHLVFSFVQPEETLSRLGDALKKL